MKRSRRMLASDESGTSGVVEEATDRPHAEARRAVPTLSAFEHAKGDTGTMADEERPPEDEQPDDEVAAEVPTTFATKGVGWSGREEDDDLDVTDLDK